MLHVQGDRRAWHLRLPREDGLVERSGPGADRTSVERFGAAAAELISSEAIGAILVHIPARASFGEISPFLVAAVTLHRRAGLPGAVGISIREIETVRGSAKAIPIGEDGATSYPIELSPEGPPAGPPDKVPKPNKPVP